jgi:hypothetical protein
LTRSQWEETHDCGRPIIKSFDAKDAQTSISGHDAGADASKEVGITRTRAQGLKSQHFSARDIAVLSDHYLNQHQDRLVAEAEEAIATWPDFAAWRCAEFNNNAQTGNETESIASVVQSSRTEWRPS